MEHYLESDEFFNQDHSAIGHWLDKVQGISLKERAVSIYYLVRDGIRYDPFSFLQGKDALGSDYCLDNSSGYCIPKAALQVTLSRANGIAARIGLADVCNHLSSSRLEELLKNNIFTMHGYVELFLDGKWVKSTPAFNRELCTKSNIHPLEFNGNDDSIFHEYTPGGDRHMEYLVDHGTFSKMPVNVVKENFALHYPHISLSF